MMSTLAVERSGIVGFAEAVCDGTCKDYFADFLVSEICQGALDDRLQLGLDACSELRGNRRA